MLTMTPPTVAHQRKSYSVDGVTLFMTWHFSERGEGWRIDVLDENEDPIIMGRRLSPGWNPFIRVKDNRMPPGEFYVRSPFDPIGRTGFDNGAALVYFTRAEADALGDIANPENYADFEATP